MEHYTYIGITDKNCDNNVLLDFVIKQKQSENL